MCKDWTGFSPVIIRKKIWYMYGVCEENNTAYIIEILK